MIEGEFDFDASQREKLSDYLSSRLEKFYSNTRTLNVTPYIEPEKVRSYVAHVNLEAGMDPFRAIDHVIEGLTHLAVHTPHPSYFGLFNPRPGFASILADLITATFNPQMAAWSHNPFANEVELLLIKEMASKLGYPHEHADGIFCSGGAEGNLTAIHCALSDTFPSFTSEGAQSIKGKPVIYCSKESHHSIERAARVSGIGKNAIRLVNTNSDLSMDIIELEGKIRKDLRDGLVPVMVVATAGTTGTGSIDPVVGVAEVCQNYSLWMHADAAFGGAAIISPLSRPWLKGLEKSDSIIVDVHKWMAVPMGASMLLTRRKNVLLETFSIMADYMPDEKAGNSFVDPYNHSIQWSRRFIGLKLYMSLLLHGWQGYERLIEHHLEMGNYLKEQLVARGWRIWVDTPLPVVCFSDNEDPSNEHLTRQIYQKVLESRRTWVSLYRVNGIPTIRACITNYATGRHDIDAFLELLENARKS